MQTPDPSPAAGEVPPADHGHGARAIALRLVAAAAVIAGAALLHGTVLSDEGPGFKTRGATVRTIEVESELLDRTLPVEVIVPKGARDGKRSLLIFLHERDADERSYLETEMFAALARQRGKAPVVAFPRGGPDSYWHDRDDGAWGSYVTEELLPRLRRRFGPEPERIGIGGISMGGFGAYNIARRQPSLFCSVGGHSPAIWEAADDTAPGAFDDELDFARNDLLTAIGAAAERPLEGKRTWVDVGLSDPFREASLELIDNLEATGAEVSSRTDWPGGHQAAYWRDHWRSYFRFYARSLKQCGDRQRELDKAAAAEAAAGGAEAEAAPAPAAGLSER